MQWFIRRAFNTPHSSKQIEDAIGWALETNAETLIASTVGTWRHPPLGAVRLRWPAGRAVRCS